MSDHAATTGLALSDQLYDTLRHAVQYWLPALGTMYFGIAVIWGLPYGEQVLGTITAVSIFFGVVMGLSKKAYVASGGDGTKYDGALVVNTNDPMKDSYVLEVDTPLEELQGKSSITLKITDDSR